MAKAFILIDVGTMTYVIFETYLSCDVGNSNVSVSYTITDQKNMLLETTAGIRTEVHR